MKIKTNGKQIFNVPNSEEGKLFLELLTKFKNKNSNFKLKKRGRSKNRVESFKKHGKLNVWRSTRQSYCPFQTSDWVAVYISNKNFNSIRF